MTKKFRVRIITYAKFINLILLSDFPSSILIYTLSNEWINSLHPNVERIENKYSSDCQMDNNSIKNYFEVLFSHIKII